MLVELIILWVICGVVAWAAYVGYFAGEFPTFKIFYGMAVFIALAGIAGFITSIFASEFFKHGFRFIYTPPKSENE